MCESSVEMVEERLCERAMCERVVCEGVVCEIVVWHVWTKTVAPSAMPAKQNRGRCFHMPRLPHKQPQVPCLPHRMKVDFMKCYKCHTESRSVLPNATPATQTVVAPTGTTRATRASPVP